MASAAHHYLAVFDEHSNRALYLDGIVKLSEVGAVANHISLMRHI
jgi:hypothetical protein